MERMYRFQSGTNRSNGIYCEPDTVHHHYSPSHPPLPPSTQSKKLNKMRNSQQNNTGGGRMTGGRGTNHRSRDRDHQPRDQSNHSHSRSRADPNRGEFSDGGESSSDGSDGNYQDQEVVAAAHAMQMNLTMSNRLNQLSHQNSGVDSPPEPAPSDLPLRLNGGLRLPKSAYQDIELDSDHYHQTGFHPQEYLMSSPYQPKSPLPMGSALATAKKLFNENETADSNSTLSTLPSQARLVGVGGGGGILGSQQQQQQTNQNQNQMTNPKLIPSAPVILPIFPNSTPHPGQLIGSGNGGLNSRNTLQRNQYSPSRFALQKDCRVSDRCSWKCVSIALIILSAALISILIYFAAVNSARYPGSGCIVVEEAITLARGEKQGKHYPSIDLASNSNSPANKNSDLDLVLPTSLVVPQLPPEEGGGDRDGFSSGLSPEEIIWGQQLTRLIEPYSFWTLELDMGESAYLSLNLSFPWGSNWALLFRKNALPSLTQHDLLRVIKNGQIESPGLISTSQSKRQRNVRSAFHPPSYFYDDLNGLENNYTEDEDEDGEDDQYNNGNDEDLDNNRESDFQEDNFARRKRDNYLDQNVVVVSEFLDSGKWFLRIFNDDLIDRVLRLHANFEPTNSESRCPLQCSGNGNCVYGICACFDGFRGPDCATSVCPILCSNHGRYGGGMCHCDLGWKGVECDIPESECEVGNCNGNGDCTGGKCVCKDNWTGDSCDKRNCEDSTCSGHGSCLEGKCLCESGWTGNTCSISETLLSKCLPDCSSRGEFDSKTGRCICRAPYTGPDCLKVVCEKDCSEKNGFCNEEGQCQCMDGWGGPNCEVLTCDPRCLKNGQCKNGTCLCSLGWNGKHCTQVGCANSCTHQGSCIMQDGLYSCKCNTGWAGLDCSIKLETNCSDDIDNDQDGMSDCSDTECCDSPHCREHIMCMAANDPVEVLLRKQPPSVTSSFFQRVKFLIEENSVQSYAQKDEYSESQFWNSFEPRFDILVNGGGSVTLHFQRNPFRPFTRTVFVPWNEIVVLDPAVVMSVSVSGSGHHFADSQSDGHRFNIQPPCLEHNSELLQPIVMSSWLPGMVGGNSRKAHVFGETQVLQESIRIPGSDVHLLYHSSQSPGYLATIMMQLTGSQIPPNLLSVHLKITIEGELYRNVFEADPNITYTFGWKKRNVYQQKVYGTANARVAIGYEYTTCSKPIWIVKTVTLKGFDVDIADVGGWNLDIHHHYNFHEGILQKGDGSEVHLKDLPRIVTPIVGKKGKQRSLLCEPCEELLLSPIALTSGSDGSLYVGDFNLIRRITPDNRIYTILQLSATKVSHQYYMTISPSDGHLYISDPEKYQILRVNSMDEIEDPRVNWSPVVGSGLKCVPGDMENCGDGFPAKLAKLNHPKGLAISSGGAIYIADGPNIRFVDVHGTIHTLVGSHGHRGGSRSSITKTSDFESCHKLREEISKVQLHWPSNIVLNLFENKLLFIDEGMLFQITEDNQVERLLKCEQSTSTSVNTNEVIERPILDLALSPKGELYFITEDSNLFTVRDSRPVLVKTDKVVPYGQNHTGERHRNNLDAGLVSALTIGLDGIIFVADQANLEVRQVSHYIPQANQNGDYEVVFPSTGEIYIFNRYGQHIQTRDLRSGRVLYSFLYTKNTSYGKLSKISDSAENKILFLRDYSSVVSTIENTQGKKCSLKINHLGRLVHFQELENSEIKLDYSDEGLLLAKTSTIGLTSLYSFDNYGRVSRVTDITGLMTDFEYQLSGNSVIIRITDSVGKSGTTQYTVYKHEESCFVKISSLNKDNVVGVGERIFVTDSKNSSYSLKTEKGGEVYGGSWGIYPLLKESHKIESNLLRSPSFQYIHDQETDFRGNKHEWKFRLLQSSQENRVLDRQMWVNDSQILTLEYDQGASKEMIFNRDREPILLIQYDRTGLPLYFVPQISSISSNLILPMNITYDRFNRIESWKWGEKRGATVSYGRSGFATEFKDLDGSFERGIEYNDFGQPTKISLKSGRTFIYEYDLFGGLKSMETPRGTRHTFSSQCSIGFKKVVYGPPGSTEAGSLVKYFNSWGDIQHIVQPFDTGRILYDYDSRKRLVAILYSEGKISYRHKPRVLSISCSEGRYDSTTLLWSSGLGKIVQEKYEFGSKSGFVAAKFVYEYDSNFRPILQKSRVGGNVLPDFILGYNAKNGLLDQLGNFRLSHSKHNETTIYDGIAKFTELKNGYGKPLRYTLSIQATEVHRQDFIYYQNSHRIQQIQVASKTINYSDQTYSPSKNYTYDADGQLIIVDSGEPWKFEYDENGNLRSLTYRANTIPLEHNHMERIVRFGDGQYKYDSAGRIVQNAREEFFFYNALGQLRRAWKRGLLDVEYFYDHLGRLSGRKDNHGNATQFFYSDLRHPSLVTHIYIPRENRLLHLTYDDSERLIFFQVNRNHKYYVASDNCGTPSLVFNQYGQVVRSLSRSPFGHIVYDSDPYFYLPVDFCGGILDKVTSLIHMKEKRVYDPLIGQFLTPDWENVIKRLETPEKIHLYRLPSNDPINLSENTPSFDHLNWLNHLGYNVKSLAPQLFLGDFGIGKRSEELVISGLESRIMERSFDDSYLKNIPKSVVTKSMLIPNPAAQLSQIDPPLGKNILLSRTIDGKAMISCPFCTSNQIYRDVFTQILNGSEFLSFISFSPTQDVFHFAKRELWKASDDLVELKRLGGGVNVTVHERSADNQMDLKIDMTGAVISVRYGLKGAREENRLVHHAKTISAKRALVLLKDHIRGGFPIFELNSVEKEEILKLDSKSGHLNMHHFEYVHDPEEVPFFADDPLNIRIAKKSKSSSSTINSKKEKGR